MSQLRDLQDYFRPLSNKRLSGPVPPFFEVHSPVDQIVEEILSVNRQLKVIEALYCETGQTHGFCPLSTIERGVDPSILKIKSASVIGNSRRVPFGDLR